MQVWMNKQSGDLVLACPRWEPIKVDFDEKFYNDLIPELKLFADGRKVVHGVLVQMGWMVQNQHEVWLGLPMSAQDAFEDLGEA